jgi:hypothetical protein
MSSRAGGLPDFDDIPENVLASVSMEKSKEPFFDVSRVCKDLCRLEGSKHPKERLAYNELCGLYQELFYWRTKHFLALEVIAAMVTENNYDS